MRTVRSNLYRDESACSFPADRPEFVSENLTDSVVDMRLGELAARYSSVAAAAARASRPGASEEELLELSQAFSDFSACSSDISGELQRLASLPASESDGRGGGGAEADPNPEDFSPCLGFLQRESFSTEIIECISPEDLQPTVKICVDGLQSPSLAVKRSAAAKLRF